MSFLRFDLALLLASASSSTSSSNALCMDDPAIVHANSSVQVDVQVASASTPFAPVID
jgi:hypothetical protein